MQSASFHIRKPVFLLLNTGFVLMLALVFFLYRNKKQVELQNRNLIIQNDSIMSVNILLADSVRQKSMGGAIQKTTMLKAGKQ